MKRSLLIPGLILMFVAPLLGAETNCGDDGLVCGDEQHCCEHVIAMFADDHATAPPYVQGQCAPKGQKCADFWCGNQECKSSLFGSPSVCCMNTPDGGATPQYSCAYSELSCPGNTQQLSIRNSQPNRTLRRG
jgi:hypothetical protein